MGWWTFVVVVAASARLTRLVSEDAITAPLRGWFLRRSVKRQQEAGMAVADVMPVSRMYSFLSCPWCVGFWISAAVVAAWWWTLHVADPRCHTGFMLALAVFATSQLVGIISRFDR